jgi:hypothetical protein
MSVLRAYQIYQTLTPQQRGLLKAKRIEAAYVPADWLTLLGSVAEFDRCSDSARKFAGWSGCLGVIVLIVGIFILGSDPEWRSDVPGWAAAAVAGLLVFYILVSAVAYFRLRGIDMPNKLRQFVVPAITILREDMEPSEPLSLKLDLRGGTLKEKQTDEQSSGPGYPKVVESYFTDRWMSGSARLADASSVQWEIVDYIRQRKTTKRNPRGKIKSKTKYKIKTLIDVRVGFRQSDYTPLTPGRVAEQRGEITLQAGAKRNTFRVRRVVQSSDLNSALELKQFLDAIASAYKRVKPSEAG